MGSEPHHSNALDALLSRDLREPRYLTSEEVAGKWREIFPEAALSVPAPYPIFTPDESHVITYGYPILVTEALEHLRRELVTIVRTEVSQRLAGAEVDRESREKTIAYRMRFLERIRKLMVNTMLTDWGRGLFEVLVLHLTAEVAGAVSRIPVVVRRSAPGMGPEAGERVRYQLASVFADLLQRAGREAADHLQGLAGSREPPRRSRFLATVSTDLLPLARQGVPVKPEELASLLEVRYRGEDPRTIQAGQRALERLGKILAHRPELAAALRVATGNQFPLTGATALLQPALWKALREMGFLEELGFPERSAELLSDLGMRVKRLELVATLRRHLEMIAPHGRDYVLASSRPPKVIARSTRPFDFARAGVVGTAVQRFGLVYDLTAFTETLEVVRKQGPMAEERALQFMYVFQQRLEAVRRRRRLTFEKFLGDGAFYSSRRAVRLLAAGAEIQVAYDRLRQKGFPFDRGLRMALNYATYHLLPMVPAGESVPRFEFFGHGVVELARLTTGKSTREIDEIAEFLVHAGYPSAAVEDFLGPLIRARQGTAPPRERVYSARLDEHGELVNEGIVLTAAFVEELQRELGDQPLLVADLGDGEPHVVLSLDEEATTPIFTALCYLGVARLKGLPPMEIVEALVLDGPPAHVTSAPEGVKLLSFLRRLASKESDEAPAGPREVPSDLLVATYLGPEGRRLWLFGRYREADGLLVDAVEVPLKPPDMGRGEPVEMWLFRQRDDLYRLYMGLCRDSGATLPLESLRQREGYMGFFLSAPHRSPV